jgi:hypothetical protein
MNEDRIDWMHGVRLLVFLYAWQAIPDFLWAVIP